MSRLTLLLVLLSGVLLSPAAAQQVEEYHIKAVFLSNLSHFVTWPPANDREKIAFVIGIYGPDPFGTIIDRAVAGETKNSRPVRIERYGSLQELNPAACSILFIHASKISEWESIHSHLSAHAVLTVADVAGFPEQGGMVNLVKSGQKIQVEINYDAVRLSGLTISSKLLSLARIVQ